MTKIIIIDFGSQYTQLIARRIRELNIFCEIFSCNSNLDFLTENNQNGIILSGGPESVDKTYVKKFSFLFEQCCPILGICFGMQLMALAAGGVVSSTVRMEYGHASVRARGHSKLLTNIEDGVNELGHGMLDVWMSHGDSVTNLPDNFKCIASTDTTPIAGIADENRALYGLQFHPEVKDTNSGREILKRFCVDICRCAQDWTATNFIERSVNSIKLAVNGERVVLGLSGGIDSSVTAALIHLAIGDNLTCLFVDNGLLRKDEARLVLRLFKERNLNIKQINAQKIFLDNLEGITAPELKRKVIGRTFIEVFEKEAKTLKNIEWLAQGTIYPDVIESAGVEGGMSHVIKSHHNVGGLPEVMNLKLLEPIRSLFKDEVKVLGEKLGLSKASMSRHPFPGPGLAVRIIGEVTTERCEILREADYIFLEELEQANLYSSVSQAFAVFLPIKSVGVKGDGRAYEYVIALRAVNTEDYMTAKSAEFDCSFLHKVATRIANSIPQVTRVVYDVTSKPPATIEWE